MAAALGLAEPAGSIIAEVETGSPAARAGLRPGDVVLRYAGATPGDERALLRAISRTEPGSAAPVVVRRHGQEIEVTVKVDEWPVMWWETPATAAATAPRWAVPHDLGPDGRTADRGHARALRRAGGGDARGGADRGVAGQRRGASRARPGRRDRAGRRRLGAVGRRPAAGDRPGAGRRAVVRAVSRRPEGPGDDAGATPVGQVDRAAPRAALTAGRATAGARRGFLGGCCRRGKRLVFLIS